MKNKTKLYLLVMLVGVGLIASAVYYKNDNKSEVADVENELPGDGLIDSKIESGVNYLEGKLQNSDDLSRGNFKLVSNLGQIYVRTERDFSALIGLDVLAQIEGTLDNFKLINIESKLTEDGFINSQ